MSTNQKSKLEINREIIVDNTQNNLDLKSETTEPKESLELHEEEKNISAPVTQTSETTQEKTNQADVDSPSSESDSTIEGEKLSASEAQEETEIEVEVEPINTDDSVNAKIIEDLQQEIIKLQEQLKVQSEQSNTQKSQYLRIVADFENFRRRTAKEKEELQQTINKKTINELLPVVDNFERARTQIKPANDGEMGIHKSYQGVYKNLVDSLKKLGVSAMRPEGKPFDPNYHEAMLREPTNEYPEGTVIEQLVRGYLLNDEILRHAMVKVAATVEEESTPDLDSALENNNENMEN